MHFERAILAVIAVSGGCYAESAGLELRVDVVASQDGLTRDADALMRVNDRGVRWSIQRGWIAVTHAELVACAGDADPSADATSTGDRVPDGASLPSDLDAVVVGLDPADPEVHTLGLIAPTPDAWCALTLQYGPVGSLDDTGQPDGTWRLDLGTDDGDTHLLHGAARTLATATFEAPISLDLHHRSVTVEVALPVAAWLEGLGASDDDDTLASAITSNLGAPAKARLP